MCLEGSRVSQEGRLAGERAFHSRERTGGEVRAGGKQNALGFAKHHETLTYSEGHGKQVKNLKHI